MSKRFYRCSVDLIGSKFFRVDANPLEYQNPLINLENCTSFCKFDKAIFCEFPLVYGIRFMFPDDIVIWRYNTKDQRDIDYAKLISYESSSL